MHCGGIRGCDALWTGQCQWDVNNSCYGESQSLTRSGLSHMVVSAALVCRKHSSASEIPIGCKRLISASLQIQLSYVVVSATLARPWRCWCQWDKRFHYLVSHEIRPLRVVVSAALANRKQASAGETHVVIFWYLTGLSFHVWWCRRLWHGVNTLVPARHTFLLPNISPYRAHACGGISSFGIWLTCQCQWDTI